MARVRVQSQITNANELKYLDEFLLNKVGRWALGWEHWGRGPLRRSPRPKPLSCGDRKARSVVPTHRRYWRSHASVCVWHLTGFLQNPARIPMRSPAVILFCTHTDHQPSVPYHQGLHSVRSRSCPKRLIPGPSPTLHPLKSSRVHGRVTWAGCPRQCIYFCSPCPECLSSADCRPRFAVSRLAGAVSSPREEAAGLRITF